MAFCANCGTEVSGNFCATCGAATGASTSPPPATTRAPGTVTAADVVQLAKIQAEVSRTNQRHGVPALLSFFLPGLGQLVKGHIAKGIVVFIGMVVSVLCMKVGIGFLMAPIVWIWQIYDAYSNND